MSEYSFDLPEVGKAITSGTGGAGSALRGWHRQKRITGSYQREKNAKIWFSPEGVQEAWELWARHKGLDTEAEMPDAVRAMIGPPAVDPTSNGVGVGVAGTGGGPHVHLRMAPGATLTITVEGAE